MINFEKSDKTKLIELLGYIGFIKLDRIRIAMKNIF
jgi:hypothetical protein